MKAPAYRSLTLITAALLMVVAGLSSTAAADSTNAYYAIYCAGDKNSLQSNQDDSLDCGAGSSPKLEKQVKSGNTNPNGEHPVTIVEADCYPGTPQSLSSGNSVSCSEGPDATLTLHSHFPASVTLLSKTKKKPKPKPPKASPGPSGALSPVCPDSTTGGDHNTCALPKVTADTSTIQTILEVLFGVLGAFAVLMITASGFKYITSAGDPQKTSEAKSGVIYALVGLMLAIVAEAIVAFIIHWGTPT